MGTTTETAKNTTTAPAAPEPVQHPLVLEFPSELPGAEHVETTVNPARPRFRIVHVQDKHPGSLRNEAAFSSESLRALSLPDSFGAAPTQAFRAGILALHPAAVQLASSAVQEQRKAADSIQLQETETLRALAQSHGSKEIYLEGFAAAASPAETLAQLRSSISRIEADRKSEQGNFDRLTAEFSRAWKSSTNENIKGLRTLEQELLEQAAKVDRLNNVDYALKSHSGVKTAEGEGLALRGFDAPQLAPRTGENALARMDRQETAALQLLVEREKSSDGLAVIQAASVHDLRNNVLQWNQTHPREQIALTEVTPNGLLTLQLIDRVEAWNRIHAASLEIVPGDKKARAVVLGAVEALKKCLNEFDTTLPSWAKDHPAAQASADILAQSETVFSCIAGLAINPNDSYAREQYKEAAADLLHMTAAKKR